MSSSPSPSPTFHRNEAAHRWELALDGKVAGFIDYRDDGKALQLVHTEVDKAYEGQGLAGRLVQHVLDQARSDGRRVVPSCAYVARYIDRHPDYRDLVAA